MSKGVFFHNWNIDQTELRSKCMKNKCILNPSDNTINIFWTSFFYLERIAARGEIDKKCYEVLFNFIQRIEIEFTLSRQKFLSFPFEIQSVCSEILSLSILNMLPRTQRF